MLGPNCPRLSGEGNSLARGATKPAPVREGRAPNRCRRVTQTSQSSSPTERYRFSVLSAERSRRGWGRRWIVFRQRCVVRRRRGIACDGVADVGTSTHRNPSTDVGAHARPGHAGRLHGGEHFEAADNRQHSRECPNPGAPFHPDLLPAAVERELEYISTSGVGEGQIPSFCPCATPMLSILCSVGNRPCYRFSDP